MTSVVPLRVVPDPQEPGAAEVFVSVELSGHPYELLLDTGGASSRLVADAVTRRFASAPGEAEAGRGVLGGSTPGPRVIVPELKVGDISVEGLVVELSDGTGGPPAILGLDVLRQHRLDVRLRAATLTLDGSDPVDEQRPLPLSSRGHPHVDVAWAEHRARAIWDTGAGLTVVDTQFARRHRHLFTEQTMTTATDAHGNTAQTPLVTMAGCQIGGRTFAPTVAAIADIAGIQRPGDPDFELILGYPVLTQADWSFDLANGWWGYL